MYTHTMYTLPDSGDILQDFTTLQAYCRDEFEQNLSHYRGMIRNVLRDSMPGYRIYYTFQVRIIEKLAPVNIILYIVNSSDIVLHNKATLCYICKTNNQNFKEK